MTALWEAAPLLWGSLDEALRRSGISAARRVGATSELPAAAMWSRITRAAAAPETVLYATETAGAPDVQVVCVAPPVVVLGPRLLGGDEDLAPLEARFLLARAAELCRPERIAAAGLPAADFAALCAALVRTFGKPGTSGKAGEQDEHLRTTLPVRLRTQLERLLATAHDQEQPLDPARFGQACQRAADRLGLLLCGEIDVALRLAGAGTATQPRALHLVELSLAERYLAARATLGVGAIR
jgi:hypothetical protein